jgi:hypothetical protein
MTKTTTVDDLLADDPAQWVTQLPAYQSESIAELLNAGKTYDDIALLWLTATAQNTFGFSTSQPDGSRSTFLASVKAEVRAYLCGNAKYKNERDGLFGEKGMTRNYVVGAIAVSIALYMGVVAPVLAPIVALVLASIGKIAVNAWCSMDEEADGA